MAAILRVKDEQGVVHDIPAIMGAPGTTAYEYAVAGGFTGTEKEFAGLMAAVRTEKWEFLLEDGRVVTKAVYAG